MSTPWFWLMEMTLPWPIVVTTPLCLLWSGHTVKATSTHQHHSSMPSALKVCGSSVVWKSNFIIQTDLPQSLSLGLFTQVVKEVMDGLTLVFAVFHRNTPWAVAVQNFSVHLLTHSLTHKWGTVFIDLNKVSLNGDPALDSIKRTQRNASRIVFHVVWKLVLQPCCPISHQTNHAPFLNWFWLHQWYCVCFWPIGQNWQQPKSVCRRSLAFDMPRKAIFLLPTISLATQGSQRFIANLWLVRSATSHLQKA